MKEREGRGSESKIEKRKGSRRQRGPVVNTEARHSGAGRWPPHTCLI